MSIQTYINKLADIILYRLQNLDRFTDHIFVLKSSLIIGETPIICYENKPDTYELCDIIHSIMENSYYETYPKYNDRLTMMLLYCPEHESIRELQIINLE